MNYLWPSIGGILIGLSATILLLMTGRIAGISGIFWGSLRSSGEERGWRVLFLVGLVFGAWLFHSISGQPYPALENNYITALIGGALVGFGVKVGAGCTSGHGVCGIGRLSKRSIIATVVFMSTGIATVFIIRTFLTGGGVS